MNKTDKRNLNISLFIAMLFHVCGVFGILFSSYKEWFIQATSFTLLVMAALIIFTQQQKNKAFYSFCAVAFITGMSVEAAGVNSGILFGDYHYTKILGPGIFGVPFLIGINWFVVVYCCGCITFMFEEWIMKKLSVQAELSTGMQLISFIIDAAILTVFYDWVLEPAAIKLNLWQWKNDTIPFYNYLCWFFISAGLMVVFRKLNFAKHNIFALHLLIIQLLFFLSIETFLK